MKRIFLLLILTFSFSGCYSTEDTDFRSFTIEKASEEYKQPQYIGNFNSKKFHYPDCESVKLMNETNKDLLYCSREKAIELGYKPCKICNP